MHKITRAMLICVLASCGNKRAAQEDSGPRSAEMGFAFEERVRLERGR